uniref:Uncharacterized protein n=1 Tax=Nelumbo nucifera TaxID=4432 RepID=A0A822ZBM6_NELNU|nr:TPA_asm: hypothetical protein HUJ06_016266 [Nelumbo nucifera]
MVASSSEMGSKSSPSTSVPYGITAYVFIEMGTYTGGLNTFVVVGLASKPLHIDRDLSELRSLTQFISLQLFENNLSGEMPKEFGNFKYLVNLTLYWNNLSGTLPQRLGYWTDFNTIDVSENYLTGLIPPDMCKNDKLKALLMLHNKFIREIPATYTNCSTLTLFYVSNDSLSSSIPTGI